jgi:hypothetical protein
MVVAPTVDDGERDFDEVMNPFPRHGRARPGHPRLLLR